MLDEHNILDEDDDDALEVLGINHNFKSNFCLFWCLYTFRMILVTPTLTNQKFWVTWQRKKKVM